MIKHLKNWFLEEDPEELEEGLWNYFSSKPAYSSDIYAMTENGEKAHIAYIPLTLTDLDHKKLDALRNKKDKASNEYLKKYRKRHWWNKEPPIDENNEEWKRIFGKYDDIRVYKKRQSKELHDAHLHLVLSSPYLYEILDAFRKTGEIELGKVEKALAIADGITTPSVTCLPKWKGKARKEYKKLLKALK